MTDDPSRFFNGLGMHLGNLCRLSNARSRSISPENYFCGSYDFDVGKENGGCREFNTPYAGLSRVIRSDGLYQSQARFGMYRWHIPDPVRFAKDLRVTILALGWRSGQCFLPLRDDVASVAYWYQTLPTAAFPVLPGKDDLEVV